MLGGLQTLRPIIMAPTYVTRTETSCTSSGEAIESNVADSEFGLRPLAWGRRLDFLDLGRCPLTRPHENQARSCNTESGPLSGTLPWRETLDLVGSGNRRERTTCSDAVQGSAL